MGQQQLLLLVLAVIIVGIAIVVGITMFNSQAASSNLDSVTNDLMNLGSRAQQYYVRPVSMGGGGQTFAGMTLSHLTTQPTNENGAYSTTTGGQQIVVTGVGNQDGDRDGINCTATCTVFANDSIRVAVTNR